MITVSLTLSVVRITNTGTCTAIPLRSFALIVLIEMSDDNSEPKCRKNHKHRYMYRDPLEIFYSVLVV